MATDDKNDINTSNTDAWNLKSPEETLATPPVAKPQPATAQEATSAVRPTLSTSVISDAKNGFSRRKKIIASIAVAAALVVLAGLGAAYALYSNPDRAVGDALSKALTVETVAAKGSFTSKSGDGDINLAYNYAGSNQLGHTAFLDAKVNMAPATFNFAADVVLNSQGDAYLKVKNAKQIISNTLGMFAEEGRLDNVIALVDDKWVKIPADTLSENDVHIGECGTKIDEAIRKNPQIRRQLQDAYANNRFIVIDQRLKDESVNGTDSLHYRITFSEEKARSFTNAFKQTKLYGELQNCDKDFMLEEDEVADMLKDLKGSTIEVWVGRWSHEFTRIKITGKQDKNDYSFLVEPTFNEPVNVDEPKSFTPYSQLEEELEKAFSFDQPRFVGETAPAANPRLQ